MADSLIPERSNLVAECHRVLRLRLAAGEWTDKLPGERRLAELLQVGRDTIRLTLERLEREGFVSPAGGGKRRQVLAGARQAARAKGPPALRIGMLSPHRIERLPQSMLIEVDHVRRALAARNGTLDLYAPPWYEQNQPQRQIERFLAEEPHSAWLLHRAGQAVQSAFEQARVPCIVRGHPLGSSLLPHIDVDWQATARHAAGRLWRLGHRRVGIIAASDALGGVAAAVRGVLTFDGQDFEPLEIHEDGSVEGFIRILTRTLTRPKPPTALIATRPRQATTALTWLASRGFRVPQHLSLITLSREPFLEYLVPRMAGYRVDPEAVARLVIRRLERLAQGGGAPAGSPWLEPDEVAGESIGPPPQE
jgi:DNA-binding LacI/PurR family transcriptional regulator